MAGALGSLRQRLEPPPGVCGPVLSLSAQDTRLEVEENDRVATTHLSSFSTDVNECFYEELNACSERELCLNVEGSYQCVCRPEPPTVSPERLNSTCEGEVAGTRSGTLLRLCGPWNAEVLSSCQGGPAGLGSRSALAVIAGDSCVRSWV